MSMTMTMDQLTDRLLTLAAREPMPILERASAAVNLLLEYIYDEQVEQAFWLAMPTRAGIAADPAKAGRGGAEAPARAGEGE